MSGWLGSNSRTVTKYTGLQVQTSALNLPVPWFWGQRRLSWNLIWQGDFDAEKQKSGKGGGKGSQSFNYFVAAVMALAEGVITAIPQVWQNQSVTTMAKLGLSLMGGTSTQTAWPYLTSKHPTQALSYANTAYVYSEKIALGSTPAMPQIDFECVGPRSGSMPGTVDVNLADVLVDFLTDPTKGMGFTTSDINFVDVAFYKTYQQAQGLFFSPALISQEKATDIVDRWAKLSNSWMFWSGSKFRIVPLGDSAITANGVTYTPVTTVQYNLTIADFIANDPPVKVSRIDPADAPNRTVVQITDRALAYNSNPIEYKDQTLVDQYGLRDNTNIQADEICDAGVGVIVSDLIGQRAAYQRNTYAFSLPYKFVRLEPGDLVTLTDPNNAALTQLPVRIKTISENDNFNLDVVAEEYFGAATTGTPSTATPQPSAPNTFNRIADPGNVNTPTVLEPNSALTGGPAEVWIAASGGSVWGGAQVYLSFDNVNFTAVGTIFSKARQGVLTAGLASHADPDTTNTLAVDLTQSAGTLDPVAHADADAFRTLAYLCAPPTGNVLASSGEIVAYGAVSSTGTYTDNLTYLRRGLYGTTPGAHSTSDLFCRLDLGESDTTIVKYPLPASYIGGPIYLKFLSFNIYMQADQDLSSVTAWQYTPAGKGYGSGSGGVPGTPSAPSASTVNPQAVALSWSANPATDNIETYEVWRATGSGASFGSAAKIWSGLALTLTDGNLTAGGAYTYFLVARNAVGPSTNSAGANATAGAATLVNSANKSASFTTVPATSVYYLDTSGGAYTVTMNATPSTNETVEVWDSTGNAGTNPISLNGNGKNIAGAATVSNAVQINYGKIKLIYNGTQWLAS